MAIRAKCIALLLSSLLCAGCGTLTNICKVPPAEGGKTSFGGVKYDVLCLRKAANGDSGCGAAPNSQHQGQLIPTLFYAADLPITLVGDVIVWPYTASYSCINAPIPVPPMTSTEAQIQNPPGYPPPDDKKQP